MSVYNGIPDIASCQLNNELLLFFVRNGNNYKTENEHLTLHTSTSVVFPQLKQTNSDLWP